LPFQFALSPAAVNAQSPDRPALGAAATYDLPSPLATKLCTIAFHIAGVIALFVIGMRLRSTQIGWALVALYAGSAFVLGVGGDDYFIGGMTYISHIAPTAMTLVAFACLPVPALAGGALAMAAGVGFYPAFLAPAVAALPDVSDRRGRLVLARPQQTAVSARAGDGGDRHRRVAAENPPDGHVCRVGVSVPVGWTLRGPSRGSGRPPR